MTFPVFASGDVLNASDMNAVGLWLVKTQTIGTSVSTVAVTSCFSSDYDNYIIHVVGGVAASGCDINLQLGSTTSGYRSQLLYANFANTPLALGGTAQSSFQRVGFATTDTIGLMCTLLGPNLAKPTIIASHPSSDGTTGTTTGYLDGTTQYTGFTLLPTANLTGGTIRVYGYRN